MPSKTPRQHRFMEAAAHNRSFAKSANIPQSVAKEFVEADKAKGEYRGKGRSGFSSRQRTGKTKTWVGK